jgi:hypothetical protein
MTAPEIAEILVVPLNLDRGRSGDDPTDHDAAKNRRALARRLGAATLLGSAGAASSTSTAVAASAISAAKLSGIIASLVIAGAAATGVVLVKKAALHAPRAVASASPRLVEPPVSPGLSGLSRATDDSAGDPRKPSFDEVLSPPPSRNDVPSYGVASPPRVDRLKGGAVEHPTATASASNAAAPQRSALGDEVDLIRAAQEHLHDGNAGAALATLAEHARRFPNGALREERQASRILALCQLGNVAAARAEADRFILEAPASPLVDRVRDACRVSPSPSQ